MLSVTKPVQKTPKYLCIVASPDNEQEKCLKAENKGDVGVLQWKVTVIVTVPPILSGSEWTPSSLSRV